MLELIRSLFARRCPAVIPIGWRGDRARCDRNRHADAEHYADRGMDEIRWTEQLA